MIERETVLENIAMWKQRLGDASAKWGECEIMAVTKTVPAEVINFCVEGGVDKLGENRVQEMLSKAESLDKRFHMHIIGPVQTNKVNKLFGPVETVQSLDRDNLALALSKRAQALKCEMNVLVQVNIACEAQKSGIAEEELLPFIRRVSQMEGLKVQGLMAIMPNVDDAELVRPYFRRMRSWFEKLRDMNIENVQMNTLSMGMSHDCLVAAQEGATMVRLGRALFGERVLPGK